MTKICTGCEIDKPLSEFRKDKNCKDGLKRGCKSCLSAYEKTRNQQPEVRAKKNERDRIHRQKPEVKEQNRIRRQKPEVKAKKNERDRIRYHQSPEVRTKMIEQASANYQKPEVKARVKERNKIRSQKPEIKERDNRNRRIRRQKPEVKKQNRIRNQRPEVKAKRNEKQVERRKTDIQFRLSHDGRTRRWQALKVHNTKKHCKFKESLGCTLEEWEIHLQSNMPVHSKTKQVGTWEDFMANPARLHIDEIIPCDAWDLTDPVQYKLCFHYSNSQLLWEFDNCSKGGYDRDPEKYDRMMAEKLASITKL